MFVPFTRAGSARFLSVFVSSGFAIGGAFIHAQAPARPTPDTSYGVHVFNDQNSTGLSPQQVDFCARRYAGTQKQTRADADRYRAVNPDFLDPVFENAWSQKLARFMDFMRDRFEGRYRFIPNVGTWVTTRDVTDFAHADGVFIEGFGYDVWEPYGEEAFTTQGDRLLGLIAQDKIVIGQSYANDAAWKRMHTLASYLLIKGRHTFLNFETGQSPEWWPEYTIPIGAPLASAPATTAGLFDPAKGVYMRDYSNGQVYLNAGTTTRTFALGATYQRALPTGGGDVPYDGVIPSAWRVDHAPVSSLSLVPGEAAIVLVDPTPYELEPSIVFAGQSATLRVRGATPGSVQTFYVGRRPGATSIPALGVTLGLTHPRIGGTSVADAQGDASWTITLAPSAAGSTLLFQSAENGHATQVASIHVH